MSSLQPQSDEPRKGFTAQDFEAILGKSDFLGRESTKTLQCRVACLELFDGGPWFPRGLCPNCGYDLTLEEILKGFSSDPYDTDTRCPKCDKRFAAWLACVTTDVPFLCERQTLAKLGEVHRQFHGVWNESIEEAFPGVPLSARFYFGSLTAGMRKLSLAFLGEPYPNWQPVFEGLLKAFPGQHKLIAQFAMTTPQELARYSGKLGLV